MKRIILLMFVIGVLLLSSVSADQKIISSENDFKDGSFSDLQLNIELTNTSCIYRYISSGYDFYTSGQHGCDNGYECDSTGECFNGGRVFVTSTTYNGNLGGPSGGDQKCNARAAAAGLGSTWTAWLSSSTEHAKDRIQDQAYKLIDGTKVCDNLNDLIDGSIDHGININELQDLVLDVYVWTGTTTDGMRYGWTYPNLINHHTCNSWTTTSTTFTDGRSTSAKGKTSYTQSWWTLYAAGQKDCNMYFRLYCFEN